MCAFAVDEVKNVTRGQTNGQGVARSRICCQHLEKYVILRVSLGPSGPGLEKICNFEDFCWGQVPIFLDLCCQHLGLYVNLGGFCGPFGPRVGKFDNSS